MNETKHLSRCRGCESEHLNLIWTSPDLPIHLWPLPDGAPSIREPASVFVCQTCGLAQLNQMSVEFVETLYDKGICVLEEQGQQDVRKKMVCDWLGDDYFRGKTILELGGGNNPFVEELPEAKERWIADLAPTPLAEGVADHVVVGNFESIEVPEAHFDVVCGFLVWEHFINPLAVTKRIASTLGQDGLLLIEVPNLFWLKDELPHYTVFHQHQSIFSLESLDYMAATAGFSRQKLLAHGPVLYAAYQLDASVVPKQDPQVAQLAQAAIRDNAIMMDGLGQHLCDHQAVCGWQRPALYGAGGSMSLFLAYSPELREKLAEAFDRDTRKTGRRVPGTDVRVQLPDAMAQSQADGMLVLANYMRDVAGLEKFDSLVTVTDIIRELSDELINGS